MPAAIPIAGAVIGAIGSKKQSDAAKQAANAANTAAAGIQFDPAGISGGVLGNVSWGRDGNANLAQSDQQRLFTQLFGGGAQQLLQGAMNGGPFGAAGMNLSGLDASLAGIPGLSAPGSTISGFNGINPTSTPGMFSQGFQGAQAASEAARGALGSFDPNAFAQQQFGRLNDLARSGEETATARTLDNLFSNGRLGVRTGGRQQELSELAYAQEQARTGRALESFGMADREQQRLASQAGMFGQQAGMFGGLMQQGQQALFGQQQGEANRQTGIEQALFQQLFSGAQFGQGQQQFQTDNMFNRFNAAQQSLGFGQNQQNASISNALNMFGALQGQDQQLLQLLGLSIGTGTAEAQAGQSRANIQANAAQNLGNARSEQISGLLGSANNFFSGLGGIGSQPTGGATTSPIPINPNPNLTPNLGGLG